MSHKASYVFKKTHTHTHTPHQRKRGSIALSASGCPSDTVALELVAISAGRHISDGVAVPPRLPPCDNKVSERTGEMRYCPPGPGWDKLVCQDREWMRSDKTTRMGPRGSIPSGQPPCWLTGSRYWRTRCDTRGTQGRSALYRAPLTDLYAGG